MANLLRIMGNRTQGAGCFNWLYSRIVALDADSLDPVNATWQYEGEDNITQGTAFYDHNSTNRLIVTAEGYDSVILNAGNIDFVNGVTINVINNDKQLKQWGEPTYLDMYPIADEDNYDFQKVIGGSSNCSFAIRTDKSLFAWGDPRFGGQLKPPTVARKDILEVVPSGHAGVLRGSSSPYIDQWGEQTTGLFTLPDKIAAMDNIIDLVCNDTVRIVLTSNGQVFAWGQPSEGGLVPIEIAELTDIVAVYVNSMSACVLRSNGQIAAWGIPENGGVIPDEIKALTDIVRIYPGGTSYVALRANGSIVVWGSQYEYVNMPDDIAALTNIVDVRYCMSGNYIILCDDGRVYGFGTENHGMLPIPDGLTNVIALTAVAQYCSALKSDGTVVNWGGNTSLDDSLVRDKLINVRAVYGCTQCMAAITEDDSLVIWGETYNGFPMTFIPDGVQGNISYMQPYSN